MLSVSNLWNLDIGMDMRGVNSAAPKVYVWQSLKRFCDQNFPNQAFRSDAQRKSFLESKNIKIQLDDLGRDGVAVPKHGDPDQKEIKVGRRLASSKLKQEDVSELSKDEREKIKMKNEKGLAVASNNQATDSFMLLSLCNQSLPVCDGLIDLL